MHARVSKVSSSSHPTIQRLCQSIMAVKYKKPCFIGIYVMSIDHAWLGCSMTAFLSKYGTTCACFKRFERFGFGYTGLIPISSMYLRALRLPTLYPRCLSWEDICLAPHVGLSVCSRSMIRLHSSSSSEIGVPL